MTTIFSPGNRKKLRTGYVLGIFRQTESFHKKLNTYFIFLQTIFHPILRVHSTERVSSIIDPIVELWLPLKVSTMEVQVVEMKDFISDAE